ncbi:MAG: hypothetical protein [Olavius algarvensis Delta 4 endosymbiont]|nr:MAG: hypothetical protein [Olavius algarvensis Delta 4 endosymbiont]
MANQKFINDEVIPGMAKQGEGIKIHVDAEWAPLKAAVVGNASSVVVPNPNTWEMQLTFQHASDSIRELTAKYPGQDLRDVNTELYEKAKQNSDDLANALRDNGVKVVRFEGEKLPETLVNYNYSWSQQKQMSFLGHSGGDVIGNCLVNVWDNTVAHISELTVRDAINEIMQNDPNAVWMSIPSVWPTSDRSRPGPYLCADFLVFEKIVFVGVGVDNKAAIDDPTVPRSANDEYGTEILRRMLKPHGWEVKPLYFDTNFGYHLDVMVKPIDRGLIALPDGALWHGLPEEIKDWEMIYITPEEQAMGAANALPLGNKKVILQQGCTKFAKDLEKRGYELIEIDYSTIWNMIGSGIHCSVMHLWREF